MTTADPQPPTDALGIPTGPVHTYPVGHHRRAERAAIIRDALRGVELGAWDEQMVRWLAGWDWCTVATIVSWIGRAQWRALQSKEET